MIVVVTGNFLYPVGMAETKRIQHIVDYLTEERRATVRLLLLRQSHPGRDTNTFNGVHKNVEYRTVGARLTASPALPFAALRYLFDGFRYLARWRRGDKQRVLYVYGEPNIENLPIVLFARLAGYRVVFDITETRYYTGASSHWLSRIKAATGDWLRRRIAVLGDAVVVISSRLVQQFEDETRGRIPVHLHPISVNLDDFPGPEHVRVPPRVVMYAGSFGDKDSVDNLIGAYERVRATHDGLELVLTGRGLPERIKSLEQRIAQSPYCDHIRYLGFLPDADYYRALARADIPCMIRNSGDYAQAGFPFKLGEYLAAGKAVIATDGGDITRYLKDRHSAVLIQNDAPDTIAGALAFLLADPETAQRVGHNARVVAEEQFCHRRVGARLYELLDSLGERGSHNAREKLNGTQT